MDSSLRTKLNIYDATKRHIKLQSELEMLHLNDATYKKEN